MAQVDIKECTIKIWDGTPSTITSNMTNANADITLTTKSTHQGSKVVKVVYVDPGGNDQPLAITVTNGETINVSLATGPAGAITSTAAQIKTAIEAYAAANALVTVTYEGTGAGVVNALAIASLVGQNSLEVKIGEGNVTYSEKRPVEFRLDRGLIDTVREADQEPMDVTLDFTWEFLSSGTGDTVPTIEEAFKKTGLASTWVSSSTDPCQPYSVDLEIYNNPVCGSEESEIITIEELYWESMDHDLRDGSVSISGRANRRYATLARRTSV